ncbi:ATP-binding protein [Actinoplanes sp. NPDC024001]|uniref:ATP-binding protein n=1 Tax=Actinoplanes sp. NPDC024001 TaxID=3154598 RepID=UPI0033C237E1
MTYRRSLARTAVFAVAFTIATAAGRLTVLDSGHLSLVWPAAGVAAIWFCAQRRAPARWADVLALSLATMAVNMATGASALMAAAFVAANLTQAAVFAHLIGRWRPDLWGGGGTEPLRRPRDLWGLVAATSAATVAAAVLGFTSIWLITDRFSWAALAAWLARNAVAVLLLGAAGICLGHAYQRWRAGTTGPPRLPRRRAAEYAALLLCSALAYLAGFAYNRGLPLAFLMIAVTVWAGARFTALFVVLHSLLAGTVVMAFTLHGTGPFAEIPGHADRAVVAQLFVAMVVVIGLSLALGREERDVLLAELAADRAELAVQRERASQRAELLRAIIDSTADGLAVIDDSGRVVLRNPAARRLLGDQISPGERVVGAAHFGLCHLDGTPMSDDEMAHNRALAGHDFDDVDLLIRNARVPDGRILNVRATTLDNGDGTRSAVVLFHDVTAERRHRDELANFAGVVAHDLLNPVTTVEGWSDAARESLAEAPDHEAVRHARDELARVYRAAVRMRALIDGLLAYTTARDAAMQMVPVDLAEMVTEVTIARLDNAIAAGRPRPRFAVRDLPVVLADPVLLRQLLDNLIGNAIKYTDAAVTPALTITAERDEDMIRVRITDNGIGIPAGQHEAIFGDFHRAHRTGPYAGTGLGLGICKRIVERHGGTITAEDAPGGGSSFTFTVPAVVSAREPERVADPAPLR